MFNFLRRRNPMLDWIHETDRMVDFTPDLSQLQQYQDQRIFVPDEMMRGHRKEHLLGENSMFLCMAFTANPYSFVKKKLGKMSYPIALPSKFSSNIDGPVPFTKIKGEVHIIRPSHFINLDNHKENGYHFIRERIELDIPYRMRYWGGSTYATGEGPMVLKSGFIEAKKIMKVDAWMYLGVPDYWNDQLDGGYLFSPVRSFPPNNLIDKKDYYYFTTSEYDAK